MHTRAKRAPFLACARATPSVCDAPSGLQKPNGLQSPTVYRDCFVVPFEATEPGRSAAIKPEGCGDAKFVHRCNRSLGVSSGFFLHCNRPKCPASTSNSPIPRRILRLEIRRPQQGRRLGRARSCSRPERILGRAALRRRGERFHTGRYAFSDAPGAEAFRCQ